MRALAPARALALLRTGTAHPALRARLLPADSPIDFEASGRSRQLCAPHTVAPPLSLAFGASTPQFQRSHQTRTLIFWDGEQRR